MKATFKKFLTRFIKEVYLVDPDGFPYERESSYYFNVSVERHNLTPVHADLILQRCKEIL